MKHDTTHPTAERLGEYAGGHLDESGAAALEGHLAACDACRSTAEEWRVLYARIAALPRFAPAPGFALRVMAGVRIPKPWHERAAEFLGRLLPDTTAGWAAATAVLALPVLAGGSLMAWLLSKSYVTTHGLWTFATGQVSNAVTSLLGGAMDAVVASDAATWAAGGLDSLVANAGVRGIGLIAGSAAVLTALSIWILYRYLVRTPNRDSNYVTFCF